MIDRKTPDELTLRRPDFLGGVPLLLSDGQEWFFPRPPLRYRIHLHPETRMPLYVPEPSADWIDAEYCTALEGLGDLLGDDYFERLAGMAIQLLSRNYNLPDEIIPEILTHELGCMTSLRMWRNLRSAVEGLLVPKVASA